MKIMVDKDSVKVLDRIVEFKLSDDNQSVVATEQCDEWFSTDLYKDDLSILIDKLIELRDRLEVIDSEIIGVKTMNKLEELKRDTRLLSDDLKTLEPEDYGDIVKPLISNFIQNNEEPLIPEETIAMIYYLPITRVTTDSDNTPVDGGMNVSYIVDDDHVNILDKLGLERTFLSKLAKFDHILNKVININAFEVLFSVDRSAKYQTYGDLPVSRRTDVYFYISKLSPYTMWFVSSGKEEKVLYSFTLHTYDSGYIEFEINIKHMNDVKSSIFDGIEITADMFKLLKKV